MDHYAIVLLIVMACMPLGAVAKDTYSKEPNSNKMAREMMILLASLNNTVINQGDLIQALSKKSSTQETDINSLTTEVAGLKEKIVRQDTLIANQEEEIATLQAKVDSQETVISNKAGEIAAIKDKDLEVVAFSARAASSQEVNYGQVVQYTEAITNTGHYNEGTSTFTVPVRGIYFFFVNVLSSQGHSNYIFIMRNDDHEDHVCAHAANDSHMSSATGTVALQCEPGDRVQVHCYSGTCKLYHGAYNRFHGFLLKRN